MKQQKAMLVLEDGSVFPGLSIGAPGTAGGEVVFNTSLTGYQEILTDPSYTGQIVVMCNPEIGNYGINTQDVESHRPFVQGLVVRECSALASNWRAERLLADYLADHGIVGIEGIDTRKLVRHLRSCGVMRGIISTESDTRLLTMRAQSLPTMTGQALALEVSCAQPYCWAGNETTDGRRQPHIVAYDFGIKYSILRALKARGFRVTVVPAAMPAYEVMRLSPDGIFLSNGPGDPEPLASIVAQIRLLADHYPIFGICLGHQLLAQAFGGKTYKLKFGHRGSNHPVQNLLSNRVEITAHNHGFAVDGDTLPSEEMEVTHINLNDQTVEGLRHRYLPVFSVQYHPEAAPGPHDGAYLFDEFYRVVSGGAMPFMRNAYRHASAYSLLS